MKNIKFYAAAGVAAIAGATYFISVPPANEKSAVYSPREKSVVRHAQGWKGASEYYTSVRKNVNTGKVEIADILNAREAVRMHSMKRSGSLGLQWRERGPDNIGGRTRAILVDKNNSNHVFAGSVSGGLFESNDAASTWHPVNDQFENLIVASLMQTPDGAIWMGTGSDFDYSANFAGVLFPGNGLFKSTDNGRTFQNIIGPKSTVVVNGDTLWHNNNNIEWVTVNRIVHKPGSSNEIYAAVNKGLRVTNNGGLTWENPVYGTSDCLGNPVQTRCEDVAITPDGRLFISLGGQLYYSDNPMVCSSYVKVPITMVPNPSGGRTCIATSPSNSNYVYALVADGNGALVGVWKSTDAMAATPSWTKILSPVSSTSFSFTLTNGQGVYDLAIAVAPDNPEKIYMGGVELWKYDGNLTRISTEFGPPPFYVHSDKHYFTFDPQNPSIVYVGTDGGVFKSFDGGTTFFAASKGYNTIQYYGIGYSNNGNLIGGSQDNGTHVLHPDGNDYLEGDGVMGGDGFDCEYSQMTGARFGTIYFAALSRSKQGGGFSSICSSVFCDNCGTQEASCNGSFNTVIRLWESQNDATSQATVTFKVDTTKEFIGTGNGTKKKFEYTLVPQQSTAKIVRGSLRIQAGSVTFNDFSNDTSDSSNFGTGSTASVNYITGKLEVNFAIAPGNNLQVSAYYTTQYDANSLIILNSNTEGVTFPYSLPQNMSYGDSVVVKDSVQSIMALGVTSAKGGVVITRGILDFNNDPKWIKLGVTGAEVSCLEFSKDGNHLFVGVDGVGVIRVSGLNDVYSQSDADTKITKTKIFGNTSAITGIAVDDENANNVVVTTGNYGTTQHVFLSTSALTAPATSGNGTFSNVTGDLPPMPVYDAEFIRTTSKVVIGTEFGVYATSDIFAGSVQWSDENSGAFPHMPVYDVRQQKFWPSENFEMLYIGTHGRGMWETGSYLTSVKENNEKPCDRFISGLMIFPNPVRRNEAFVSFNLPVASSGNIRIYDLNGRNLKSLLKLSFSAGSNNIKFDTENIPAGAYFVTVETENSGSFVSKFIVTR